MISPHTHPDDPEDRVRAKVNALFTELAGAERAQHLKPEIVAAGTMSHIAEAIAGDDATEAQRLHAEAVAFHLADWNSDAAFMTALHLYPERFTREEIAAGIRLLMQHVPYHLHEAARAGGWADAPHAAD